MSEKYLIPVLFFLAVIFAIVVIINPFSSDSKAEQSQKWEEINQEEVLKEIGNENAVFVDLREKELYAEGHIPGAINIPYEVFQQRYDELDEDKRVVLICHTGRMGIESAGFLVKQGFDDVANFGGGMTMWDGPLDTE
ncbi:rhodanese-like domain-containing protein [Halalkalibacterium halodurans]|uniref:rhodanese-like domain-containing protein n=1 Tax=Halalkalibacterium halodurans TaxID=86665 RepID=UPI001067ADAC|nr:rhodanese-like domain-containing protein [Halalkalibacterium halodurans]TES45869.1 rhodanese-like domain-containing protein [Halalkalibacterium halodurans]